MPDRYGQGKLSWSGPRLPDPPARGYENRADGVFHPEAASKCDVFVATFKGTLEKKAVALAKREHSEDVQPAHVERVYNSIGPSYARRKFWREVSKYALGVAVTTFVGLTVGQVGFSLDQGEYVLAAAACFLVVILAAPLAFREFLD